MPARSTVAGDGPPLYTDEVTRTRRSLGRLALASLSLAAVALLGGCSLLGGGELGTGPGAERDESGQVVEGSDNADVFTLQVGDCVNDRDAAETISEVPIVPCSDPHDSEIFASVILSGDTFPGEDAVFTEGDTQCGTEFETFVGVPYVESIYDFSYYVPTESSWSRGDREILCVIFDPAGQKLTGSLEGIAR